MAVYNARSIGDRSRVTFRVGNLFQSGEWLDIQEIPAFLSKALTLPRKRITIKLLYSMR